MKTNQFEKTETVEKLEKADRLLKTLICISWIMIAIYLGGFLYQWITQATPIAKVFKIADIVMFLLFIVTLKKKMPVAPVIGILITLFNLVLSLIYLDLLSIIISLVLGYECFLLIKEWQQKKIFPTKFTRKEKRKSNNSTKNSKV